MSRRFGNEDAEIQRARQRAAEAQARYDEEQEEEYRREFPDAVRRRRAREVNPRGGLVEAWKFMELVNSEGDVTGYEVIYQGTTAGIIVLRPNGEVVAFSTGDEHDLDSPDGSEILSMFMTTGPGSRPRPPRRLPEGPRSLPEGSRRYVYK